MSIQQHIHYMHFSHRNHPVISIGLRRRHFNIDTIRKVMFSSCWKIIEYSFWLKKKKYQFKGTPVHILTLDSGFIVKFTDATFSDEPKVTHQEIYLWYPYKSGLCGFIIKPSRRFINPQT